MNMSVPGKEINYLKKGEQKMRKTFFVITMLIAGITLLGCGATTKEIRAKTLGEKTDIFHEVKGESTAPQGFADVVIKASIKTHHEGYYILESKESLHGKKGYPFVINIDGQAVTWKADGQGDNKPKYDGQGKAIADPEAGDGIQYVIEKKIRLAAGPHRIFLGLPEDDYAVETTLILKEGGPYVLEFKPVYKSKRKHYSIRKAERFKRNETYLKGIKKFDTFLDGNPIPITS